MLKKIIAASALAIGFSTTAHAAKIFEWNDPSQGNYPPECSASQTYGTGGGGYGYSFTYDEFTVNCPGHPSITIGVEQNWSGTYYSCKVHSYTNGYTTSWNSCNNWRVYD